MHSRNGKTKQPAERTTSLQLERLEPRCLLSGTQVADFAPAAGAVAPIEPIDIPDVIEEIAEGAFIIHQFIPGTIKPSDVQAATSAVETEPEPSASGASGDVITPRLSADTLADRGLDIVLHIGPGLAANEQAASAFQQAAEFWESVLFDPVTINIDAELTSVGFEGTDTIGRTSSQSLSFLYNDVRQRLVADASPNEAIVADLPDANGQLQFDLGSRISVRTQSAGNPVIRLTRANALALGFSDLPGSTSHYTAGTVIDASVKFNAETDFDFDPSDGITVRFIDFLAVAIHEIGHVLGFISSVDQVDATVHDGGFRTIDPTVMDLFRIAPGQGDFFSTTDRILNTGSSVPVQVFYDGQYDVSRFSTRIPELQTGDIPLSTGTQLGDGHQASHLKDNTLTGIQLGVMDPTLRAGVINNVSQIDLRIMDLIGWDWHDTEQFGTPPSITVETNITTDTSPAISGTVSETDARVLIRLPQLGQTDSATLIVDGDPASSGNFLLSNAASSHGKITRMDLVLPDIGISSGTNSKTPFFDTSGNGFGDTSTDFQANASAVTAVGLLSPESDTLNDGDVFDGSKTLTLLFDDFDPGESISWQLDLDRRRALGSDLKLAQVFVTFDDGVIARGTMQRIAGNSDASQVTITTDHFIEAENNRDGTWTLTGAAFGTLELGTYDVLAAVVDTSGAVAIDETLNELVIQTPGVLAIGNLVFEDQNRDGLFNPQQGETGISGVSVNLLFDLDKNNAFSPGIDPVIGSQTTDSTGVYRFDELPAGNYIVQIAPENFDTGGPLEGFYSVGVIQPPTDPDDDVNDDNNGQPLASHGVVTAALTLRIGEEPTTDGDTDFNTNLTVDFGLVPPTKPGQISGVVWNDMNQNALRDIDEPGLEGWTVFIDTNADLIHDFGEPFAITDISGAYILSDLDSGLQVIAVVQRPGWVQSFPLAAGPQIVQLSDGESLDDIDFGSFNKPPVAQPGGPYAIEEGGDLSLDGSASQAGPDDAIVLYEWDLDFDGVNFNTDRTGPMPIVPLGDDFSQRTIGLRVTDSFGVAALATSTLQVTNVAPTIDTTPPETAEVGGLYSYQPTAFDPAGDADPLSWILVTGPFGMLVNSQTGAITWTPDSAGEETVSLEVSDGDGGMTEQTWTIDTMAVLSPADFNADFVIDRADFLILVNHFGQSGVTPLEGDLNGDEKVGIADLDLFQQQITSSEPAASPLAAANSPSISIQAIDAVMRQQTDSQGEPFSHITRQQKTRGDRLSREERTPRLSKANRTRPLTSIEADPASRSLSGFNLRSRRAARVLPIDDRLW